MFKLKKKTTGQDNSPYKYYRTAAADTTERPAKKSPAASRSKFIDIFIIVLLLAAGIYILMLDSQPKVSVDSTLYHPNDVYTRAVDDQFDSTTARSKVSINQAKIIANLKKQFPEIDQVSITLPFIGHQATVKLQIARPSLMLISSGQSFIIDANGKVVARAIDHPDLKTPVTIKDESGFIFTVGDQVLSQDSVNFINAVIAQTKKSNIKIDTMTIPPVAQELYVKTADANYSTKFFLGGDPAIQLGQFIAARNSFKKSNHFPNQYLDVRVEGKVFYK